MSPLSAGLPEHRAIVLDPARADDLARIEALRAVARVHDTLAEQREDLARSRAPGRRWTEGALAHADASVAAEGSRWIWLPWTGELVHLLPPEAFRELRLDRNRQKVTREEQAALARRTVGVVGLSVGNAVATTLALEGVAGRLKLADFDTLSLSNLNRIRASITDLGLPKVVLAARQLATIDPYLEVELFPEGLTEDNLERFLDGADVVVEECDALGVKAMVRRVCRARRIPVIMETSDRGLLDVERFDEEPDRPLLHGALPDWEPARYAALSDEERIGLVARIVGMGTVSVRASASLLEIRSAISSWPQLGSDVVLGGATVTAAVRRLGLGLPLTSGRRYVDLDRLLAAAPGALAVGRRAPLPAPDLRPELEGLLAAAVRAPSGGNCQPWRFHVDGDTIWLVHDRARSASLLDVRHEAALVALGAATENLVIAASHQGLLAEVTPFPDAGRPDLVARIDLAPGRIAPDPLLDAVFTRVTDRRHGPRVALAPADRSALADAVGSDARLRIVDRPGPMARIGDVLADVDRVRFLHPRLHAEMMGELRWTSAEADATADGMCLDELEVGDADTAIMTELARPEVAAFLRRIGGGSRLGDVTRRWVSGAAAMGLLSAPDGRPESSFRAGRAAERVWLTATSLGLGVQPVGVVSYMVRHLGTEIEATYLDRDVAVLRSADGSLSELFGEGPGERRLLLFRLVAGLPAPAVKSRRRPLSEVVSFGAP